jgi:hypothetical protein
VTFVAIKVRRAIQVQRGQGFTLDFFSAIKVFAMKFFPKYLLCHCTEMAVFLYFINWKEKKWKMNLLIIKKVGPTLFGGSL